MLTYKTSIWVLVTSYCLLLLAYLLGVNVSFFICLLPFILFFITLVFGSGIIGLNFHLKSLHCNYSIESNAVAITFDDGPNPEFTPKVLELLDKYQAKSSFFCIGKHIEKHPDLFTAIINRGHTVGNHTYSHVSSFGFFSTKSVKEELKKTSNLVEALVGLKMNLFRPAFGVTNPNISRAVNQLGLTSIGWSVRSLDTTYRSEDAVFKRITKNLKKGDVILLHDTSEKSLRVLEQLLIFLKNKDTRSITVDALLNIKAYA